MHPFGEGGGPAIAAEFGVELLGQVPLDPAIRAGGDSGSPAALEGGPVAEVFKSIAALIDEQLQG
jgi:ATP-binding protein involved in chromosome partitioning